MKKLLIASAALAMVAGTAQAQSSVTVYGVIDTGYNSLENTNSAGTKVERSRILGGDAAGNGEAASSRLGFRGTEDLGGGLRASFVVESGIGATTANAVGDRAFWAGLQDAKLGELRIGRQDTFGRTVWLANDQLAAANVVGNLAHSNAGTTIDGTPAPFAAGSTADSSNTSMGAHTARLISANYLSPRMNGFQFNLGLMQDKAEQTSITVDTGSGSQVGLNYAKGKLTAGIAYLEAKTSTVNTSNVRTSDLKTKETVGGASYNLGFATVGYVYNKRDVNQNFATGAVTGQVERESHSFSASIPMGAKLVGRVGYGYGEYKGGASNSYNGDLKGMQAALNYNLSKRTMAYVIYGDESREISATTKAKAKEYSVGVRHSF